MTLGQRVRALAGTYIAQRVMVAGLVFGASILCARGLRPDTYAELAFFLFLSKALLMGNVGAASGYLVRHYTGDETTEENARSFVVMYAMHMAFLGLVVALIGLFAGPIYWASALGFLLLLPLTVVEPLLRIKRRFGYSLLPDALLSIAALLATGGYLWATSFRGAEITVLWLTVPALAILMVPFAPLGYRALGWSGVWPWRLDGRAYSEVVRAGFPRYAATGIFTLLLWMDRVFLERFYDRTELGIYLLAFQLATGAALMVSAHNMVSGVDIGEAIARGSATRPLLGKVFRQSLLLGLLGLAGVMGLAIVLEHGFLLNYPGLAWKTLMLSIGLVAFQCAANVTDVAYYQRRHKPLIVGLVMLVCASLCWNALLLYLDLGTSFLLAAACGTGLLLYSVLSLGYCATLVLPATDRSLS